MYFLQPTHHFFIILFFQMSSEQSSFREIFDYPREGAAKRNKRQRVKAQGNSNQEQESSRPLKESFYDIVKKAKHVAMFARSLKKNLTQKTAENQPTLSARQLQFFQSDSQAQQTNVYFEHHNKAILAFQLAFILTLLLYLWNCTFQIVFGTLFEVPFVQIITLCMYVAHIVIFTFTQYKNQKFEFISDRNKVIAIYMKEKITKDALFLMMLAGQFLQLEGIGWLYIIIRIVSLICYGQLISTWRKIEELLSVSNQAEIYLSMLKLIYKIIAFLHSLSIALNILAKVQENNSFSITWIQGNGIDFGSNIEKYVVGWYWGATILSTVGFGEITPKNNYERFFISIVQVICCMTFGYFVNVIGALIKLRGQSQEKYEKQVRSLNRCLNFLSTTNDLKHKIRTYLFNRHVIEQVHDPNQEKQVLENLTPPLHQAVLLENNIKILKKSTVMEKFKEETLVKLTQMLKKVILAPQHIIYNRNTTDRRLWFIESGSIEEFTDNFNFSRLRKVISVYNEQDSVVGWINFLTQTCYKTMAKAKIFTIAYQLQEKCLIDTLKEDKREYLRYLHMRQMMIEKNRKFVPKCISCDSMTHNVVNCARIHFIRKDVKKLAQQNQGLETFLESQSKKKKFQRFLIRYGWKSRFGEIDLEKSTVNTGEKQKGDNNMENFLKHMMVKESIAGFQKKRMSFMMVKKESVNSEPKESKKSIAVDKSFNSYDQIIENNSQSFVYFDKVFFCDEQTIDFMPNHDIQRVLEVYAHKFTKKQRIEDRLRKFMKK